MTQYIGPKMKEMDFLSHAFAYVTLGLICGWYYFLLILLPILLFCAVKGSLIALVVLITLIALTFAPLKHEPWLDFMFSWVFRTWCQYFDFSYTKPPDFIEGEKYMFFEYPHGIFPMGPFISIYYMYEMLKSNKLVCGTAASVVFCFPVMRQLMAWTGAQHATEKGIRTIFAKGQHACIIPGGIAEMYLASETEECIYLRKRLRTVKMAMKEGAHIVPCFFFGNTRLFTIPGSQGGDSWISTVSRKMRASMMVFYGRHFLPVPHRHPIVMGYCDVVRVTQCDEPTDEQAQEVLDRVIVATKKGYEELKPEWETRPLKII